MARRYRFSPRRNKSNLQQSQTHSYEVNRVTSKSLFLVLFLAAVLANPNSSASAETQPSKVVRGVLTTIDSKPLSGATVEIFDQSGGQVAKTLTDSDGQFAIVTNVVAGQYELIVTNSGQLNDEQIQLGRTDLNIRLAISPIREGIELRRNTVSARQLAIPPKTRARIVSAQRRFERGNIRGAMTELDAAVTLSPSCSEAWSMRAFIKLSDRDIDGAIRDASRAFELDRTNAEALVALGTAFNSQKNFETAEARLHRALSLHPDSWQAQLELAKAWYGQRKFVLALRQVDLVQRDFPDVHLVRANILMSLGRKQAGAEEFEMFLRAAPGDRRAPQIKTILSEIELGEQSLNSY